MNERIDERAQRIQTLKAVIRSLHHGEPVEAARARLVALVDECGALEIAAVEQDLLEDGIPAARIIARCDLHARVVRGALEAPGAASVVPSGHPIDVLRRENATLLERIARLRASLVALGAGAEDAAADPRLLGEARNACQLVMEVHRHYERKERLLFPILERHGINGPSAVMCGKDSEVLGLLADLDAALPKGAASVGECRLVALTVAEPALVALEEMVLKEEHILFPLSLQSLGAADWDEIETGSGRFGYCLDGPL